MKKSNPDRIEIICTRSVNDKNERQPNRYDIFKDGKIVMATTDVISALQAFINRLN